MGEIEQQQLQQKAMEYHAMIIEMTESGNCIRLYNAYDCAGNVIEIKQSLH